MNSNESMISSAGSKRIGRQMVVCIDISDDGLWLYRNILPTGSKVLAFVGSNTLTFMNIFTAYIQAYWLTQLLAGVRPWPEEVHMKETVQREKAFKRQYYPFSEMRGALIELYMQHYHDVLFCEMYARSPFNCAIRPFADLFVPVLPSLMKGCLEPLVMGGSSSKKNQHLEEAGGNDESVTSFSADESHSPSLILHVHENETPSQQQLRALAPFS